VWGRCEWNSAAWPQCGQVTLAPSYPFFLLQVLPDRLGGDLVGDGADLELVVAEEVGVVGGDEVGGEFADLVVGGLTDGSGEIVDLGLFLGRQRMQWHGGLRTYGWIFLSDARIHSCVQRFHQLSRRPPGRSRIKIFLSAEGGRFR